MVQYCGVPCSFQALEVVNARALENANMAVIVGAIVLRAVVYSALYWTLPRDKQALLRQQAAESFVKDVPELTGKTKCHFSEVLVSHNCQKPDFTVAIGYARDFRRPNCQGSRASADVQAWSWCACSKLDPGRLFMAGPQVSQLHATRTGRTARKQCDTPVSPCWITCVSRPQPADR